MKAPAPGAAGGGVLCLTRLIALAAVGAGAWAGPAAAQQRVPVVLNHLMIVLDSATYRDVLDSPFLREQFAATETRYLAFDDVMGTRLIGKYNILAFGASGRADGTARDARPGDVAIVLGTDVPRGLSRLAAQGFLDRVAVAPTPAAGPARSPIDNDLTDVLRITAAESTSVHTGFAIVEYTSAGARRLAVTDSQPESNLSNARFLAPYYDSHRLFEYVSAATLAVPVEDIAKIARVLERDSVTVLHEGEGAIIKLDGFTLHLIPPWTGAGVKQLQFALTREAAANPVYRFGPHSQLRFGPGPIAVWDFTAR